MVSPKRVSLGSWEHLSHVHHFFSGERLAAVCNIIVAKSDVSIDLAGSNKGVPLARSVPESVCGIRAELFDTFLVEVLEAADLTVTIHIISCCEGVLVIFDEAVIVEVERSKGVSLRICLEVHLPCLGRNLSQVVILTMLSGVFLTLL